MKVGAQQEQRPQQEKGADEKPSAKSQDEKLSTKKTAEEQPGRSFVPRLPPQPGTFRDREVLVRNLSPEVRKRLREKGYKLNESSGSDLVHILLPGAMDAWTAQRELQAENGQSFLLNHIYERPVLDSVPIEGSVPVGGSVGCSTERCYGRRVIGWQDKLAACARGVKIGIIDTGYDANHPAFKNLKVKPKVVMGEGGSARAPDWHGTGVLSLLAGAATSSTPGLVPDAEYLIADAFFSNAAGRPRTDTAHLVEALRRLEQHGAQIINMSLVGPQDDLLHERIVDMVRRKGVVFIAAAGNGGPGAAPVYPAAYRDEVIAVTAVDDRGKTYDYANRGNYIDVAAPGVRIWTAQPNNMEAMLSGTSFAAPFVTAIAAVVYNNTALQAQLRDKRLPLDPKAAMLGALAIAKVGNGERDNKYGLGLVKAPSTCTPAPQPIAAPAKKLPPAPAAWHTEVRRTSLR